MKRKFATLGGLFLVAVALIFLSWNYEHDALAKLATSLVAVTLLYGFFSTILGGVIAGKISESKTRYALRKTASILFYLVAFVVVLRVWVPDPQALLVAYGLVGAGIAIALQDVFKNFAGGVLILLTRMYQVGNRIEVDGVFGDVIDIGLFHTSMLEVGGWIQGDQATGRITQMPNGRVLSGVVQNYTKDHHYLWDELSVVITPASDWREMMQVMEGIAHDVTKGAADAARQSLTQMEQRYYLEDRDMEPNVYLSGAPDGAEVTVRYAVEARERRGVKHTLLVRIIERVEELGTIEFAPRSMSVTVTERA